MKQKFSFWWSVPPLLRFTFCELIDYSSLKACSLLFCYLYYNQQSLFCQYYFEVFYIFFIYLLFFQLLTFNCTNF